MKKIIINNNHIKDSIINKNNTLHDFDEINNDFKLKRDNPEFTTQFIGLKDLDQWGFDTNGNFSHNSGRFFKVTGMNYENINSGILLQPEIGTLGVICTFIDEVLHFLIQFKGEPGNLDFFQLSPTIQATKSNYSQVHGGNLPPYWEVFNKLHRNQIVNEGILSEQGTRYFQKFNRNVIIYSREILEELPNFRWMTLGQLYEFNNIDNSINSCLRSVMSLVNPIKISESDLLKDNEIEYTINKNKEDNKVDCKTQDNIKSFYNKENDSIEFKTEIDSFSIKGLNVNIKGREVSSWFQPIVVEEKNFNYYLFRVIVDNDINYLWTTTKEPGYSFGFMYGPTILETSYLNNKNNLENILEVLEKIGEVSLNKTFIMSEEGGRFWRCTASHHIYDVFIDNKDLLPVEYPIFDQYETYKLLENGYLSIEARSLLYFSNSLNKI